jgi:Ras-related GTP-binding protein C/D
VGTDVTSYDRKQPAEITDTHHPPTIPGAEDEEEQTAEASSIIRLQNGMVLYLREINKSGS